MTIITAKFHVTSADTFEPVKIFVIWLSVKLSLYSLPLHLGLWAFPKQALVFTCLQYKSFENTGKRRKCMLQAISPFPTVFSTHLENIPPVSSNLKLSSANSFSLEESEICRLGKG